jgi:YHYH protein/Carbohydrate binding domain
MPILPGIAHSAGSLKDKTSASSLGYRTNSVFNPSFETDTTGWVAYNGSTVSRDTAQKYVGSASLKVVNNSASGAEYGTVTRIPLSGGQGTKFTVSCYVRLDSAATTANYFIRYLTYETSTSTISQGSGLLGGTNLAYSGNWVRLSGTFAKSSLGNYMNIRIYTDSSTPGDIFWIDGVMVERSYYTNNYYDGNTTGGFWQATTDNSASATTNYMTSASPITVPSFDITSITASNTTGSYPSTTKLDLVGTNLNFVSDGDPFPAKAGVTVFTNDGVTARSGFGSGNYIADLSYNSTITYRGGTNTASAQATVANAPIGFFTNGVVLYDPSAGSGALPGSSTTPPTNFHWNKVFNKASYGMDAADGYPTALHQYSYCNGSFVTSNAWNNPVFSQSGPYYGDSNYQGDTLRHPDGHSKIVGVCYDGYPIYGPYGYTTANNNASGVSIMTSSYRTLASPASGRTYTYVQYPAGSFIEDYEYVNGLGTLDQYNGRYCVTPEYPNGTYAYFLTFDATGGVLNAPAYPYVVGPSTKQTRPV